MFTLEQIYEKHSKVKSGSDFPNYIQDLKKLGVTHYEAFVTDGHTDYYGNNNYRISSQPKYNELSVSKNCDTEQFKKDLQAHQMGKTNYQIFCNDCAKSGVNKWIVSMEKMTCIYYDVNEKEILSEQIPDVQH